MIRQRFSKKKPKSGNNMKVSRARSGLGSAAGPEEPNIVRSSAQLNMALDITSTNILDQRMSVNPNPKFKTTQ